MSVITQDTSAVTKSRQRLLSKFIKIYPEVVLLIILNFIVFGRFLIPGVGAAFDWVYWTKESLKHYNSFPAWINLYDLGSSDIPVLDRGPVMYLFAGLVQLFGQQDLFNRLLWFVPLPIIGCVSAYLFSQKLFQSRVASFFVSFFFVINTTFIMRISFGHGILLFGYVISPLILWLILLGIEQRKLLYFLFSSCTLALAFVFDIRIDFFLTILLGSFVLWQFIIDEAKLKERLLFYLKGSFCLIAVPLLTYAYVIAPLLVAGGATLPAQNSSVNDLLSYSYADIIHSLTAVEPFWPTFIDLETFNSVPFLFLLLPLLALVVLWLRRANPNIIYFSTLYIVFAFLAKGAHPPFQEVNIWIFAHVPGFVAFREATKFLLLVDFALAILIGAAIKELVMRIQQLRFVRFRPSLRTFLVSFVLIGVLVSFVMMLKAAFTQDVQGTFASYQLPEWQKQIEAAQIKDQHFYRTLWVPDKEDISPFSDNHPIMGQEPVFANYNMRPFTQLTTIWPPYWSYLLNPAASNLLNLVGVKYVYIPNVDYHKDFFYPDTLFWKSPVHLQELKTTLDAQSWLRPVTTTTTLIPAYQTSNPQDHFFVSKGRLDVLGPDNFFNVFDTLPNFNFSDQDMVPLNEHWNTPVLQNDTLVFNQTNFIDYILNQVPADHLIEPFSTSNAPDSFQSSSVWNKNSLITRFFLQDNYDFDYGKGFIYSNGTGSVNITFNVTSAQAGNLHLWLRMADNPAGASLELQLDQQKLNLNLGGSNLLLFNWHDAGVLNFTPGKHTLTVDAKSGSNILSTIALLSDGDFKTYQQKALADINSHNVSQIEKFDPALFIRPSPTKLTTTLNWSVPKSAQYSLSLHTIDGVKLIGLLVMIDGQKLIVPLDKPEINKISGKGNWYTLPPLNLSSNTGHQVTIELEEAADQNSSATYRPTLDYAILNENTSSFSQMLQTQSQPATLTYNYISPTKYVVHIKQATRPFDLVFSEAYDRNWGATYRSAKGQKPDEAYEMMQAYRINQTGDFDVTIEYRPQKFVYLGLVASGIGLVIVMLALFVFWRKHW